MKIYVKVKVRAKENRVERIDEMQYKVWVKAVPEKGRANQAVIEILSEHLGLPKSSVFIVAGHTSAQKIIQIESREKIVQRALKEVSKRHSKTLKALAG